MQKGWFSESQIVAILKQQESGQTVARITREHAIREATFYTWNCIRLRIYCSPCL